jgi:hypothetical protein
MAEQTMGLMESLKGLDVEPRLLLELAKLDDTSASLEQVIRREVVREVAKEAHSLGAKQEPVYFSRHGNISDLGWVAFYHFFTEIGVIDHAEFNKFLKFIGSGVFDMVQLKGFCIASKMPTKISRNDAEQLHCEDSAAVVFPDGYEQFYWRGLNVPANWILDPGSITKQDIEKEENLELRRCIREIIGTQRYAELLDIVEIDRDHVNGQDVVLYRSAEKDSQIDEYIYYVKVICHSTLREYFLCVPEESAKNAWMAVAYTFSMNPQEYKPIIET